MRNGSALRFWIVLIACSLAGPASAVPISWTDWAVLFVPGLTTGSATGTAGGVTVTYTGEVQPAPLTNPTNVAVAAPGSIIGPSWQPATTFSGGGVDNPPPPGDAIGLVGGPLTGTNTLTFSTPVVNPVMAIWSLGASAATTYVFGNEDLEVVVGGPSLEFNGSAITEPTPSTVQGIEGNGVIRFLGTFTTIDWTVPTAESFHRFTVGIPAQAVPEPASLLLLGLAIGLAGVYRRRRQAD